MRGGFNARRGIFSFFPRPSREISLESWSRTRKLNPEGNDAIHFDASFRESHATLSISLRKVSSLLFFFFSSLLLSLPSLEFSFDYLLRCFNERFL